MRKVVLVFAASLLALGAQAQEQKTVWSLDPAHSSVGFSVRHMMVSNVRGEFTQFSVSVTTVADKPETAQVEVSIQAASIDTRIADRDKHLRSADFLDVEKFPTITFVSKKVEPAGNGKFRVTGDLTIKGVSKPVVLEAEVSPVMKDPWGNLRVGVHATTTINRKDFGVSWHKVLDTGEVVVGDDVRVNLDVELVRKP
ncbi:MAG: polyisoprenoid-binding protein [Thermoanaerobaculum sp.]|nr:MAG: polyisoprenoid-binding protein [Thermoanaerobaculum sp.]